VPGNRAYSSEPNQRVKAQRSNFARKSQGLRLITNLLPTFIQSKAASIDDSVLRPIGWGFIATIGGGVLWILLSWAGAIGELATGEKDPGMLGLVYVFGFMFLFSFPIAIVAEILLWFRRRRKRQAAVIQWAASSATVVRTKYCTHCGTALVPMGTTGKSFCPKCNVIYE
jgi:hypothetical protein